MIISRAPTRITLAGGGTDIKSYYSRNGGFLIAGAIDKYVWITAHPDYHKDGILLKYSEAERVNNLDDIKHPLFRECLRYTNIPAGIEIASLSDIPPSCGLGSSGAFTVALLNALHAYKGQEVSWGKLAEDACHIEIDVLGEPIGKQDQCISSFGGLTCFTFKPDGSVAAKPLKISRADAERLNGNLLLFDTGLRRRASEVLSSQVKEMTEGGKAIDYLDVIKRMAYKTKELLEAGELDEWGGSLDTYWGVRKQVSGKTSNPQIDEYYETGIKNGALGGKLIGAGAGGFLMFYCPKDKIRLTMAMERLGLERLRFSWDWEGAKIWKL